MDGRYESHWAWALLVISRRRSTLIASVKRLENLLMLS
jgi:hypothetical protein